MEAEKVELEEQLVTLKGKKAKAAPKKKKVAPTEKPQQITHEVMQWPFKCELSGTQYVIALPELRPVPHAVLPDFPCSLLRARVPFDSQTVARTKEGAPRSSFVTG